MNDIRIIAASRVNADDVRTARLGTRFGRMDLASQLALLAVDNLGSPFETLARERIGICLVSTAGSLSTDVDYWQSRVEVGGPSPTLFTYTLPSAPLGEIAIRFRLTGPNLCFVGPEELAVAEGAEMLRRGEADGCVCVTCDVVTEGLSRLTRTPPAARAFAVFLQRGTRAGHALAEFGRDLESLVSSIAANKNRA
jgi:3-oxoacyl-(acyl-carrier-protein) synthase